MKKATIIRKYLGGYKDEVILIENAADLAAYESAVNAAAGNQISQILHSTLPMDKLDHMPMHGIGGGLLRSAMIKASARALMEQDKSIWNNPVYRIGEVAATVIEKMTWAINDGERILVNKSGIGYMLYDAESIEIVEVFDAPAITGAPPNRIKANSLYIVLENDWSLPQESAEYLYRVDSKFSAVFDLRNHSKAELCRILEKFKKGGGQHVFVYTTGQDVPQMYAYTEAILEAGLTSLVFYFVAGVTPEIKSYLEAFSDKLEITVLDKLKK